ncbi:MAG: hypothetical protein HY462_00945 [Parcubacteria group bacterium]|nr:hypothetical protein [Parcubacteria group bacterium]
MYLTVHAAAGAAAGTFIAEPWVAFAAGIATHFILDMIPHGDEGIESWTWFKSKLSRIAAATLIDCAVLLVFFLYWIQNADMQLLPGMLYGAAGGIVPDTIWGLQKLTDTPLLNWYCKLHSAVHRLITKIQITTLQGFGVQLPFLIIFTWIITRGGN